MSRARDESPFEDSPSKRIPNLPSIGLQHYDIYLIPSSSHLIPSSTATTTTTSTSSEEINSACFLVVSQQSNLETGLGISYSLLYSPPSPSTSSSTSPSTSGPSDIYGTIKPHKNPGFSLRREINYQIQNSIQLGWIETESYLLNSSPLEKILLDSPVAIGGIQDYLNNTQTGLGLGVVGTREIGRKIMRDWLVNVMMNLEFNGICCNGELLASGILRSLQD